MTMEDTMPCPDSPAARTASRLPARTFVRTPARASARASARALVRMLLRTLARLPNGVAVRPPDRAAIAAAALCTAGALAIPATPAAAADVPLDGIAAVVNEGVVLASEVRAETAFLKAQADSNRQALPEDEVLRERVLERLIDQEIRRQRARDLGIVVDATAVNRAIERVARSNNMDVLQLRRTLGTQGLDYERFRRSIEQELLLQRLVQRDVESRVRVSAREIDDYTEALGNDVAEQRRYRLRHILVAVPASAPAGELAEARERVAGVLARLRGGEDFAAVAAATSDGSRALQGGDLGWRTRREVPAFLREALTSLEPGELSGPLRSADGLHLIRVDDIRSGDGAQREETLARHVFVAGDSSDSAERLARARARIVAGEPFEAIARELSEDPNSAPEGGELPWFATGELPAEMENVARALDAGELSEPFRTQFGWHVLEVLERRTRDIDDEALRQRAENALRQRRIEQETERWERQLRDESFVERRA